MMEWWNQRENREQALIGAAATLLAVLVLWQFVYKPIANYPAAQERAYKQAELDLKIMQKGQRVLQGQTDTSKPVTTLTAETFQSTVTEAAKTHGLVISRRQPKGYEEISLWLEDTNSKALFAWIDGVTGSYNVTLIRAQLYRNDDASIRAVVAFKLGVEK